MKTMQIMWYVSIFVLSTIVYSCSDDNDLDDAQPLVGQWVQFERAYSIGGPLIFEDVDGDIVYEILSDKTFSRQSDQSVIGTWKTEMRESGDQSLPVVSFSYSFEGEDLQDDFVYEVEGNVLKLTPIPFCIEGCFNRFERM